MLSWNMSGVINIAVLPPGACPEASNPTAFFIRQRMYGALTRSWWIMAHSWVTITGGDIGGHPAWSRCQGRDDSSCQPITPIHIFPLIGSDGCLQPIPKSLNTQIISNNQISELLTWRNHINHPAAWEGISNCVKPNWLFETTTDLDCSSMLKTGIEIAQHLARARALFARCEASPSSLRCSGLQLSKIRDAP